MKAFRIVALVLSTFFVSFCCAEKKAPLPVKPIKQIEIKEIDFANLPTKSQTSNLATLVQDEKEIAQAYAVRGRAKQRVKLYPFFEEMAYVNGELCHVGCYPRSTFYTVIAGPHYGTQTVLVDNGAVLVNYDYEEEFTPDGVIFYHFYPDSKVITGSTQVIKYY